MKISILSLLLLPGTFLVGCAGVLPGLPLDLALTLGEADSQQKRDKADASKLAMEKAEEAKRIVLIEEISKSIEDPKLREKYGKGWGEQALLARRFVEAGVRFVTVLLEGWDTHQDNFNQLGRDLLPSLDQSLSAMLDRLGEQGRLESTSILVTGEFGRTPKVNNNAGRDHWARAMCALMAGGSVNAGQVVGSTDAKAEGPMGDGFSPDDLAATFLQNIGINPKKEYEANVGRPITLIRDGAPIRGVLS